MNENFWSNLSTLTLIINKNFEESFALIRSYVMTRTKTEPSLVDGEFKLMFHTNRDLKEDFESLVRKYHSQIAELTVDNVKVSEREMAAFNKACDIQQGKLKDQRDQLIFLGASEKTLQIFDKNVNDWLIFQSEFSDYIKNLKFSSIRIQGDQITKRWMVCV